MFISIFARPKPHKCSVVYIGEIGCGVIPLGRYSFSKSRNRRISFPAAAKSPCSESSRSLNRLMSRWHVCNKEIYRMLIISVHSDGMARDQLNFNWAVAWITYHILSQQVQFITFQSGHFLSQAINLQTGLWGYASHHNTRSNHTVQAQRTWFRCCLRWGHRFEACVAVDVGCTAIYVRKDYWMIMLVIIMIISTFVHEFNSINQMVDIIVYRSIECDDFPTFANNFLFSIKGNRKQ